MGLRDSKLTSLFSPFFDLIKGWWHQKQSKTMMQKNLEYAALQSARRSSLFNRKEAFAKSGNINNRGMVVDRESLDMKSSRELLLELPNIYLPQSIPLGRRSSSFAGLPETVHSM